jgi:murein L,D-transpeptidase YcbB/YkuD
MRRHRDAHGLATSRSARRAIAFLLAGGISCAPPSPVVDRTAHAERAAEIAQVFETTEPYSRRQLDSTALAVFLSTHPTYRAESTALAAFYDRRARQFAWFIGDSLTTQADAFRALAGLGDSVLPLPDPSCEQCLADTELRLSAEFLRFATRNYSGHYARDLRELEWFIPRAKKDIGRLLDSLASSTADLSAYEPLHPQYVRLRAAVSRLRALEGEPWPDLALPRGTRRMQVGDSSELTVAVRERLLLLGDVPRSDTASGATPPKAAVYDSALVQAVQRFQARRGLTVDGVIGPGVLRALNITPAAQLRTLLVNMERLRWLPESLPPNALIANIPEFRLRVFDEGREVMTMPIVVGEEATKTAIFAATLTQVVLSPTWTVPASIVRKEILPAMRRDPRYLRRNHMDIIGGTAALPMIRQRPGADNALGRVKFVFPNGFGIYMHDTPAKSLFAQEQRTFSHGCIRLSRPRELAEFLLRSDPAWPPERIEAGMLGERETPIRLQTPRPVWVVYFTAWVDDDGQLHLRDDVYGHDARLAQEVFR